MPGNHLAIAADGGAILFVDGTCMVTDAADTCCCDGTNIVLEGRDCCYSIERVYVPLSALDACTDLAGIKWAKIGQGEDAKCYAFDTANPVLLPPGEPTVSVANIYCIPGCEGGVTEEEGPNLGCPDCPNDCCMTAVFQSCGDTIVINAAPGDVLDGDGFCCSIGSRARYRSLEVISQVNRYCKQMYVTTVGDPSPCVPINCDEEFCCDAGWEDLTVCEVEVLLERCNCTNIEPHPSGYCFATIVSHCYRYQGGALPDMVCDGDELSDAYCAGTPNDCWECVNATDLDAHDYDADEWSTAPFSLGLRGSPCGDNDVPYTQLHFDSVGNEVDASDCDLISRTRYEYTTSRSCTQGSTYEREEYIRWVSRQGQVDPCECPLRRLLDWESEATFSWEIEILSEERCTGQGCIEEAP